MEEPFRVSLCLKRYFSDERVLIRLVVDERWERVELLKEYLRTEFGLSGPFHLISSGHLLPPREPLRPLLRDEDVIEAVPSREQIQDRKQALSIGNDAADSHNALQLMKTKALSLLDTVEKNATGKRKRVRRRTPRMSAELPDDSMRFIKSEMVVRNPHSGSSLRGRLVRSLPLSSATAASEAEVAQGAEVDGLKTGDHYDMNVQVKVTDDT